MDPRSSRILGIIGIIIAVLLAGYVAHVYLKHHSSSGALIPSGERIVLSASDVPAHDAMFLDTAHKSLVPIKISSQGTQSLYAETLGKNYAYYLISGPASGESTLYRMDLKHPEAGLDQLTQSDGEKLDLTVNEDAGVAAFTAQTTGGKPHVIVLDMKTTKEKDLGEGVSPHILAAGANVLFEQADSIVSVELQTGKVHKLAKSAPADLLAVSNSQFAVYDAKSNTVKMYRITSDGTGASETGSSVPGERPEALLYSGGTLLMARMLQDTLVVSTLDALHDERIPAPGFSLSGFSLNVLES